MKTTIKSRAGLMAAVCVVALLVASVPGFAAQGGDPKPLTDQQLLQMYPPSQIQAFRAQFNQILSNMSTIAALTGATKAQEQLANAQGQMQGVSNADIARWMAAGANLAPLQTAMQKALTVTASQPVRQNKAAAGIQPYTTAGFPNAVYGSACSGFQSNSDVVFAYNTALNAAKLVWIPLNRACEEVLVVAGEGGNTSAACIVADEVLEAAQYILDQYTICDGDTDSGNIAGNYARLAYINGQIDDDYNATITNDNTNTSNIISNDNTNTSSIISNDNTNKDTIMNNINTSTASIINNDNTNAANIISNDNTNKDAIIANDNTNTASILAAIQALAGQQLQIAIEANLSSSIPTMGFFELPASQGGHLEDVAQIVTNTINNLSSAGQGVGNANYYLGLANSYYSAGRYKLAYYYYGYAYRSATNAWS